MKRIILGMAIAMLSFGALVGYLLTVVYSSI